MSESDLKEKEEVGAEDTGADYGEAAGAAEKDEVGAVNDQVGKGYSDSSSKRSSGLLSRRNKMLAGGGGGGILVIIFLLFLLIGQQKVISFGHILSAAGYARFNGVMNERMTQDIFDATVSEGEGSTALRGRTLAERFKFENANKQLAEFGREGEFKLKYEKGELKTVKLGDQQINLDEITKESFPNRGSYREATLTERARVRFKFTERAQTAVNETFSNDAQYLRSPAFRTISDNIGFKFSRWRQAGRNYFGKTAAEADVLNKVETQSEVGGGKFVETGVEELDSPAKSAKAEAKLKDYLEKNGGKYDQEAFLKAVAKDTATAGKIGDVAEALSPIVLVATMGCLAKEAFDKIPETYNQNVDQLKRTGLAISTGGDQSRTQYTYSEAVGAGGHQLDGGETSPYYQTAAGLATDGDATIPNIKPNFSPTLVRIIENVTHPGGGIPLVGAATGFAGDKFCQGLLSPQGQVGAAVIGVLAETAVAFLTAGGSELAEQGAIRGATEIFLTSLKDAVFSTAKGVFSLKGAGVLAGFAAYSFGLGLVVDLLSGAHISGAAEGEPFVTNGGIGIMLQQNTQLQTLYGRPVDANDSRNTDKHFTFLNKKSEENKGFTNRYFATSNPYSLTNVAIAYSPSSLGSLTAKIPNMFTKIGAVFKPSTYFSIPLLASHKAHAESTFDPYQGFTQIGYASDELNKMRYEPSYSVLENDKHISKDTIAEYDTYYAPCFSPPDSHVSNESDGPVVTPYKLSVLQQPGGKCSAQELSKESVLRYRIYKFDSLLGDQVNRSYEDISPVTLNDSRSAPLPKDSGSISFASVSNTASSLGKTLTKNLGACLRGFSVINIDIGMVWLPR